MFTIVIHGRTYRYPTREAAGKAASAIFARTRIVVGIVEEAPRPRKRPDHAAIL